MPDPEVFPAVIKMERGCLTYVDETVSQDKADETINISWAAYHASH